MVYDYIFYLEDMKMSKFCTKCGATLDDNATFCTACGNKMGDAPAAANNNGAAAAEGDTPLDQLKDKSMQAINNFKSNPQKNTYIGIAVVAVVVVLLIVLIVSLFGGGGYKGTLKEYFKSITSKDAGDYLEVTMPDVLADWLEDEADMDKDDLEDAAKDTVKDTYNDLKDDFGKDPKISFKITDKEKADKDDREDMEEMLEYISDDVKWKVGSAYYLELELTIKGDDDKEDEIDAEAVILKLNGDWVVFSFSCDDYDYLNSSLGFSSSFGF